MAVTRSGFTQVVGNAFAGFGFSPEGPTVYEFPMEMFLPESDLTPINENIDKIVYGLTKWEPKIKEKGIVTPPKVTVEGKDYEEAVANMNLLSLRNMWSDGLPILPATEERVNWILTGTDLPPDTAIGKILPRGGLATVESLAVCLAMAGGRPDYLPVEIAVVEALVKPGLYHQGWQATTNSNNPVVIVNGPIAKQIRLNSGYGCLGPDPAHPAGATIGRALRLLLMDLGGAIPGVGTMAIHGTPGRYTNVVFAEDEDGLPAGWEPLSVERGSPPGSNTVTMVDVNSAINLSGGSTTTEDVAKTQLTKWAQVMRTPGYGQPHYDPFNPKGTPGVLLMARGSAQGLGNLGWSKDKTKSFLWEATTLTPAEVEKYGLQRTVEQLKLPPGSPLPLAPSAKNLLLVVAGGSQSGHGYWMSIMANDAEVVTAEIKLPAKDKWDALLKQAETDLGPLPPPMQ